MRPEALEIDGFTVFREPTRVDFADADLFAFTGATGAGKSSLIDAMIFALYGSVPRLGEKAVAPVISQGRQDARVRLDFALGHERYTATRIVRRGKTGNASTREARLERGDEVVAGNVKELDTEVARLIGLDFRQFTTCAVLPQGDFARFLHATPADRQKLLTQLLGFAVYVAMRQRAGQRAAVRRDQAQAAEHRLEGLADATKALQEALTKRLDALSTLQAEATQVLAKIAELQRELEAVAPQRAEFASQLKALRGVRMPDDVRNLAAQLLTATQAVDAADQARNLAQAETAAADVNRDSLGDKGAVDQQLRLHRDYDRAGRDLADAKERTAQARTHDADRQAVLHAASEEAARAREALEAARRTHAAHELRGHLVAGEPCPVCSQPVAEPPRGDKPTALVELEDVERKTNARRDAAQVEHQAAATDLATALALQSKCSEGLAAITTQLEVVPGAEEIEDLIGQIAIAESEQRQARHRLDEASQALISAQRNQQDIDKRGIAAWTAYHETRDALGPLTPPSPRADDLPGSWVALQTWATGEIPGVTQRDNELREKAAGLAADLEARTGRLAARFAEHDLAMEDDPQANLLAAVTEASVALAEVRGKRKQKKRLRAEVKSVKADVVIAETLARHLRADGFERWLLHEAFARLASGASRLLLELSNGQYAFRHDGLQFEVIDHANAGETRSARTLSGGETFLASLSLALALADEVADLATEGTARLESIFLDEGFGTLDPGTLDVVATAIEELGARGRMVGVVTHVAALAERIPVQFKVAKASGSASVQRIDT